MEKKLLGKKIGISLLILFVLFLPLNSSLFADEMSSSGPSTERENGKDAESGSGDSTVSGPSTERETSGDAGSGASKGLKINKWWWIGGGVVAIAAVIAAAGGGGGGGGGGGAVATSNH